MAALLGASSIAIAPLATPGALAPTSAALGGAPEIETLGFAPLVGEFAVAGLPIDHIVVIWDEILDRSSVPPAADFTVTINGADHVPTQVAHLYAGAAGEGFAFGADGVSFMRIDLPAGVTYQIGDTVLLDYAPSTGADPIRDLSLTPAAGFSDVEVLAEDFGAFEVLTAVIDSYHGADKLVLVLTDPIQPSSVPDAGQFAVEVDGVARDVTLVTDLYPDVGLAFIELTLEAPVSDPTSVVELSYTSVSGTMISRHRTDSLDSFVDFSAAVLIADAVSGTLNAGESLTTADPGGTTPEDPVAATITTTGSGPASIEESLVEGTAPAGYAFFGHQVEITMPDAPSADQPNVITFELDPSIIPAGETADSIVLFRNGVAVADCTGSAGTADPSPCISERSTDGDGTVTLTVLTVQASTWNLGIVPPYAFGGFLEPVDPDDANVVRAGRAVPVKFSLDGDRGLDIFLDGSPSTTVVDCGDLAAGEVVETTLTAGQSSLTYDASSDTYEYVWKTERSWEGTCRRLTLRFADGSAASALFDFRR